jgi:cobalt-zinc-cadmium efflux system outer membrane protein
MRLVRLWLFLALLPTVLAAGELQGQEVASDLDRLIEEALVANPDLAAALARWEAAREVPAQVGALPDPNSMAKVIRFRDRGLGVRGEGETWYMLTQEVPFPGKLGLRSEVARREAERTGKEYEALRLDIVQAVRLSYYRLLHAELLEEITLANQGVIERTLEIARAKYEVGSVPQQEVLLARVEHARIGNELAEFRRRRRTAVAELSALLNRSVETDFTAPMEPESRPPALALDVDSLAARALAQRPELGGVRLAAARDTIALRLARKAYLPDLMLGVEYWVGEGENPSPLPDERYVLDVGFTIPWIWKGKHDAAVREARAQLRASRYAYEEMANRIRREVETAAAEARAAAEQVRSFEESILPEASFNLESATEAYRTDRVGFLTLLDAQRSLNELRIAYHTMRVELLMTWAQLERAVGNPAPGERYETLEPPGREAAFSNQEVLR